MNLAQIDLNLLVALDALLRERNVTRAGQAIGLSQPAMSSVLFRLRRTFGDELLVRVGREYHLTPCAQDLREPLTEILRLIELTVDRKRNFEPSIDERVFSVAASDYATFLLIQPLVERVLAQAPGVKIQVRPIGRQRLQELRNGDLDFSIWPKELGLADDLPGETLLTDRWTCAVWTGNKAVGETLSLDEYLDLPHAAYGLGIEAIESQADQAIDALHRERRVRVTVESFFLLPMLLRGTSLVALVHERLGKRLAETADIRLVQPAFETPQFSDTLYWHPRNNSDPAHRWLRGLFQEISRGV